MPGKKDVFKPGKKENETQLDTIIEKIGAEFLSISIDTLIVIKPSNAHHSSNYDTICFQKHHKRSRNLKK